MANYSMNQLPEQTCGLKLHRLAGERLIACETVFFLNGRAGVDTVLRRAQLAGRVEVGGDIKNHFADVITSEDGEWSETVALDAQSYSSLKNHWMRCKVESADGR